MPMSAACMRDRLRREPTTKLAHALTGAPAMHSATNTMLSVDVGPSGKTATSTVAKMAGQAKIPRKRAVVGKVNALFGIHAETAKTHREIASATSRSSEPPLGASKGTAPVRTNDA